MVSFSLRQRIFFTSPADTLSVSFHLSQFGLTRFVKARIDIAFGGWQTRTRAKSVKRLRKSSTT